MHVDVVGVNVDEAEALDQHTHDRGGVVHSPDEHGLVADRDAAIKELVARGLGDGCDLVGMIEVGVNHHLFAKPASAVCDARQGVEPRAIAEELLRHNRRHLGGPANAPHVRHGQKGLADIRHLLIAQLRDVPTRDEDVFHFRARSHVLEGQTPALDIDAELQFGDLLGVQAHSVAAGAETAVDWAGVERQEENLVRIAVRQPGHRHVLPLVQGVEIHLGMVRQVARGQRDELDAQRILVGPRPVDERKQIG